MTVRTFSQIAFFTIFTFVSLSLGANPLSSFSKGNDNNTLPSNIGKYQLENICPPVTNIQVEFLPNGKALIFWDPIQEIPKYKVKVVDENGTTIINTLTYSASLFINGLIPGMKYEITVCYLCPDSGSDVCGTTQIEYVIIEDLIVMMNGNPCDCKSNAAIDGICPSSLSSFYPLTLPRVYNVSLTDGAELSFIAEEGVVNIVGNCRMDFNELNTEIHGINNLPLPYYDLGSSRIHFHGTEFCVSGESVAAITYCELTADGKIKGRDHQVSLIDEIYPNPFNDLLQVDLITLEGKSVVATIQVFDAAGHLVLVQEVTDLYSSTSTVSINTAQLRPGFYWLTVIQPDKIPVTTRVVKIDK